MSTPPTVDSLTRFLGDDPVVARTLQTATTVAGVAQAAPELTVIEEEDVARLAHLGLESLSALRGAFERLEPVVARLLGSWREDSDSAITPQELLWALTYIMTAHGEDPADRVRALVVNERWWQRISEGHRSRFLERTVSQVAAARRDPEATANETGP